MQARQKNFSRAWDQKSSQPAFRSPTCFSAQSWAAALQRRERPATPERALIDGADGNAHARTTKSLQVSNRLSRGLT
jgi:hypothetical protein